MMHKLALGTVQFGLDYGINNPEGKISQHEVAGLLDTALEHGVTTLDTAHAYGESETVLSSYRDLAAFNVVSKMAVSQQPVSALAETLEHLGQKQLYGYMLHDFTATRQGDFAGYDAVRKAVDEGLVVKGGFSVYYPSDLEFAWKNNLQFELVQLPFSVLDQRFLPMLEHLKSRDIEIHVRSVFLQGLVFLPDAKLSGFFAPALPAVRALRAIAEARASSVADICLRAVLSIPAIDRVVIGVNNIHNLTCNLEAAAKGAFAEEDIRNELSALSIDDESILLPFNWK